MWAEDSWLREHAGAEEEEAPIVTGAELAEEMRTGVRTVRGPTKQPADGSSAADGPPAKRSRSDNPKVYFDMSIGGKPLGRIIMEVREEGERGGGTIR